MLAYKWPHILQLYNELIVLEYSPVTVINRAFVYAKVYGSERALREMEKIDFPQNSYYHGLMGFLYSELDVERAIGHYRKALALTGSVAEQQVIAGRIRRLGECI